MREAMEERCWRRPSALAPEVFRPRNTSRDSPGTENRSSAPDLRGILHGDSRVDAMVMRIFVHEPRPPLRGSRVN
jgi:hypothetical protein